MPEQTGIELIAAERQRQIEAEGWSSAHDDGHVTAELAGAACAYAEVAQMQVWNDIEKPDLTIPPDSWPWKSDFWKPSQDPVRNLAKAGALIAAEIDRLQRAAGR